MTEFNKKYSKTPIDQLETINKDVDPEAVERIAQSLPSPHHSLHFFQFKSVLYKNMKLSDMFLTERCYAALSGFLTAPPKKVQVLL